jgi:hypothetical protein
LNVRALLQMLNTAYFHHQDFLFRIHVNKLEQKTLGTGMRRHDDRWGKGRIPYFSIPISFVSSTPLDMSSQFFEVPYSSALRFVI